MKQNRLFLFFAVSIIAFGYSCNQTKFPFGERIFLNQCADCHMDDGQGLSNLYPSLKSKTIISNVDKIPCIIRAGIIDSTNLLNMPPMLQLSDVEITNVINYILKDLNSAKLEIYLKDVQNLLDECTIEN